MLCSHPFKRSFFFFFLERILNLSASRYPYNIGDNSPSQIHLDLVKPVTVESNLIFVEIEMSSKRGFKRSSSCSSVAPVSLKPLFKSEYHESSRQDHPGDMGVL